MPTAKVRPLKKLTVRDQNGEARVRRIFELFSQSNPDPKGDLDYFNNFTLLVAVVLSAQATDVGVTEQRKHYFSSRIHLKK